MPNDEDDDDKKRHKHKSSTGESNLKKPGTSSGVRGLNNSWWARGCVEKNNDSDDDDVQILFTTPSSSSSSSVRRPGPASSQQKVHGHKSGNSNSRHGKKVDDDDDWRSWRICKDSYFPVVDKETAQFIMQQPLDMDSHRKPKELEKKLKIFGSRKIADSKDDDDNSNRPSQSSAARYPPSSPNNNDNDYDSTKNLGQPGPSSGVVGFDPPRYGRAYAQPNYCEDDDDDDDDDIQLFKYKSGVFIANESKKPTTFLTKTKGKTTSKPTELKTPPPLPPSPLHESCKDTHAVSPAVSYTPLSAADIDKVTKGIKLLASPKKGYQPPRQSSRKSMVESRKKLKTLFQKNQEAILDKPTVPENPPQTSIIDDITVLSTRLQKLESPEKKHHHHHHHPVSTKYHFNYQHQSSQRSTPALIVHQNNDNEIKNDTSSSSSSDNKSTTSTSATLSKKIVKQCQACGGRNHRTPASYRCRHHDESLREKNKK